MSYHIPESWVLLQLETLFVDLSKNNLTGTLPSSWADLTKASFASKNETLHLIKYLSSLPLQG